MRAFPILVTRFFGSSTNRLGARGVPVVIRIFRDCVLDGANDR
jgi:hypothetical protein